MLLTSQPKWLVLFFTSLISLSTIATAQDAYWPEGKTYCVTLTYDDGLPSHMEHALPQLKETGFKGTFFWLGAATGRWSQDDLDQVREDGHELAGHTILHPCPRKFEWVKAGNASEDYDDVRMAKELDENLANQISNGVKQGNATFAYPCGCTYIGEDKHSYVPLVKERFFAARSTKNGIEVPGNGKIDLFDVKTIAGDQHDLAFQLAQVAAAKETNGWLVFMFHGVGGDHLAISADDHREILRSLQNDDSVWVATFQEAAAWVKSKQEKAEAGTPKSESPTQKQSAQEKATPAVAGEESVKPGFNKNFVNPELDVDSYVKRFEIESREVFLTRERVLSACEIEKGDTVADVGAGTGLFSRMFSVEVGSEGWVYSVDIAPRFLEHINKENAKFELSNITGVLCAENSVNLPPKSSDVVFVCDTYHHFEYPKSTLASIRRALKDDGHLIVIDFERIEGTTRKFLMGHVRAGKEVFLAEILEAGFTLVEEKKINGFQENYFLKFKKN